MCRGDHWHLRQHHLPWTHYTPPRPRPSYNYIPDHHPCLYLPTQVNTLVSLRWALVKVWSILARLGQNCGRPHASGFWLWRCILPSARRQWRTLVGYQDLELCSKWQIRPAAPTAAQSRFYLDKTQRENIVGCWDKTVAWVLAKHGLAFGKTQLWPTHNIV